MATTSHVTLDFSQLIAERTRQFSGREWVFKAVDQWLRDPNASRTFLLTGGPGTGKTAIAARLAAASLGSVTLDNVERITPGFLAHMHFCQAGLDSTLSPMAFVQTLSESLANLSEPFRVALENQASPQVTMSPVVKTGNVAEGATVAGVIVKKVQIDIHGDDARAMFDSAVRQPLRAHASSTPTDTLVILVDSLDEALTFSHDRTIAHLLQLARDFPPQVRFLLTARSNNSRVVDLVGPPALDLIKDAPSGGFDDVKMYARVRLAKTPEPLLTEIAEDIAGKSKGNFLYAYHVLNQLVAAGVPTAGAKPSALPDGIEAVYRVFVERDLTSDDERWNEIYRPLLGAIVVARGEGLTRGQLIGITRRKEAEVDDALKTCSEFLVGGDNGQPLRVYHQSFQEFLLADTDPRMYPAERHEDVATYFLGVHGKAWRKCEDPYALRYTPLHLAEAARGQETKREELVRTLIQLNGNQNFQTRCTEFLKDVPLLQDHFVRAVTAASLSNRDEMLPWIARAGRGVVSFRGRFLTGASVVALAREGATDTAEGRLTLFQGLDRDWQTAAGLIIAWLAFDKEPQAARDLADRLTAAAMTEPLPLLVKRLNAVFAGQIAFPVEELPPLAPEVGLEIVRRLSGQTFDREMMLSNNMNVLAPLRDQTELIEAGGYAATLDAPVLVNSARVYGEEATANLDAYLDAHAGYNYVEYRNRSLWVVLHAVLRHHPDQRWVRDRLERILGATLMSGGADFSEMAPLASAAMLQRSQIAGSLPVLDEYQTAARDSVTKLTQKRGANDSWSLHRRRLTMLMELETLIGRDPNQAQNLWAYIKSLEEAHVLEGYAGFRAPAELHLVDALRLCGFAEAERTERQLIALGTAHHIQDYRFCARITARCNALARWHAIPLVGETLEAAVGRLVKSPGDVEFTADHTIGEAFKYRGEIGEHSQMIPVWEATNADTLERLADVFQRPAVEFLRLNPTFGVSATIPRDTHINVPDPGMVPLLAVHLAARVAPDPVLGLERTRLIRSLIPGAAANATCFDIVLAYLAVASDPEDDEVLAALVQELGVPTLLEDAAVTSHVVRGIPT